MDLFDFSQEKETRMLSDAKIIKDDPAKVWEMLKRIDICMFVTYSGHQPNGRPMSTIPKQEAGAIYLLTEATSGSAKDVEKNNKVLLSYQGGGDHVCITGTATLDHDKALIKHLWSVGAQAFWPDGPDASDVVALVVNPDHADYWDGPNPIVGSAKFLFGLVTGKTPDLGERGAVDL